MRRAEDPNTHREREREQEIPTMVTLRTPTESHQHCYHQIERYEDGERQSIRRVGVEIEEEKTKCHEHVTIRSLELPLVKVFFSFFLRSGYEISWIEFI